MDKLEYETKLLQQGFKVIGAVDEVGVGAFASDIVACAVVLDLDKASKIEVKYKRSTYAINDSKQVPKEVRNLLVPLIKEASKAYAFGIVTPDEINSQRNTAISSKIARQRSIENLSKQITLDAVLVDYFQDLYVTYDKREIQGVGILKGDTKSLSIAAASILAKTYRDDLMSLIHEKYPQYGFDAHAGYGTPKHLKAIKEFGITPIHRYYVKDN